MFSPALKLSSLAFRWGTLSLIGMGSYQLAHCDTKGPAAGTKGAGCGDPVCQSTSDMFSKALKMQKGKESAALTKGKQCPLSKDEIGRSTWDVIHTIAAHFPESPDSSQKDAASLFMASLALLYPCSICAPDFQEFVQKNPPRF
jgi:FAD-linked sulfhydryl oxidase